MNSFDLHHKTTTDARAGVSTEKDAGSKEAAETVKRERVPQDCFDHAVWDLGLLFITPCMQWKHGGTTKTYVRKWTKTCPAAKPAGPSESVTLVRSPSETLIRLGEYNEHARLVNFPHDGPLKLETHKIQKTGRIFESTEMTNVAPIICEFEQALLDITPIISGGVYF
jgi:hypothetical protein